MGSIFSSSISPDFSPFSDVVCSLFSKDATSLDSSTLLALSDKNPTLISLRIDTNVGSACLNTCCKIMVSVCRKNKKAMN